MENRKTESKAADPSKRTSLKRPSTLTLTLPSTESTSTVASTSTSTSRTSSVGSSSSFIRGVSPNNISSSSSASPSTSPVLMSSSSISPPASKKTKRLPLHVEAIIHPQCPISFHELSIQIEEFVKDVGQASFMYKEGKMDLSKASLTIQSSCVEIAVVDIPLPSPIHEEVPNDDMGKNTKSDTKTFNTNASKPIVNYSETSNDNNDNQGPKSTTLQKPKYTYTNQIQTNNTSVASWSISKIIIHCYSLSTTPPEPEELDDNDSDEPITVCDVLQLPHQNLHTSWENLIYERSIKENIIGYAESSLLFANKNVSNHIISWNRVLLLHGPPGTGKTSLCRSLAHKLSIRMNHIFPSGGYLLEVKSHSLFSKWFSESGSRISKLFERICEMVEDEPNSLFCVLIDEVESLASSRVSTGGSGGGGSEPSDAVRAVNSVLTSLDSIRGYRNVLVLTTTNITGSIDAAFIDRVDLKQYVGYPCLQARYEILRSCIKELIRVGIVTADCSKFTELKSFACAAILSNDQAEDCSFEMTLLQCAEAAENLSGRSLRKLPFQSHAFFVRSFDALPLSQFLASLKHGIDREKSSRNDLDT